VGGAVALFTVFAGGDIEVTSPIFTEACGEDAAQIYLQSESGSITSTKKLTGRTCGPEAIGLIEMLAFDGAISATGPMEVTAGKAAGGIQAMNFEAGTDVTLKDVKITTQNGGGGLTATAGGDVSLLGNVKATGKSTHVPYYGEGSGGRVDLQPGLTGKVLIKKKVDVSCSGIDCTGGSIDIAPGCYANLTGAKLFAKPDGAVDGCTCIHPSASTTCDGGCILDRARIIPPLPALPPC
jgi:hypothetical protein